MEEHSTPEILSPGVTYERISVGPQIIDIMKMKNTSRSTVDISIGRFGEIIQTWPEDQTHYSLWNMLEAKSVVLMTPYMKAKVTEGYMAAKSKLVVAVVVNESFLDADSRAFLKKQNLDVKDVTGFFSNVENGLAWLGKVYSDVHGA